MELFEGHDPSSFPYHGKILPGKLKEHKIIGEEMFIQLPRSVSRTMRITSGNL